MKYHPSNIQRNQNQREAFANHPQMYIGRKILNADSLYWIIQQIIEHAIDPSKHNKANKVVLTLRDEKSLLITDNGRGLPCEPHFAWLHSRHGEKIRELRNFGEEVNLHKVFDGGRITPTEFEKDPTFKPRRIIEYTFTWLYTGEPVQKNYQYFGHLYYMGAILNIISNLLDVTTIYEERSYSVQFEGEYLEMNDSFQSLGKSGNHGTSIMAEIALNLFGVEALNFQSLLEIQQSICQKFPKVDFQVLNRND